MIGISLRRDTDQNVSTRSAILPHVQGFLVCFGDVFQ